MKTILITGLGLINANAENMAQLPSSALLQGEKCCQSEFIRVKNDVLSTRYMQFPYRFEGVVFQRLITLPQTEKKEI